MFSTSVTFYFHCLRSKFERPLIFRGGGRIHFDWAIGNLMSFKYRDKKIGMAAMRARESGFSMIELMIVCVIMVIIAGIAVPNIFQTYRNYQLDSAGHSVASLLQQARIQAVKTNLPAYVNFTNAAAGNMAFVTNDPTNTTYAAGEPDVQLSPAVTFQATPPDHAQLDAYINATPQAGNASIGFNARGLPCTESGGNPTVCGSGISRIRMVHAKRWGLGSGYGNAIRKN